MIYVLFLFVGIAIGLAVDYFRPTNGTIHVAKVDDDGPYMWLDIKSIESVTNKRTVHMKVQKDTHF